jgi:xylose isomerase
MLDGSARSRIAERAGAGEPQPRSGRQERLENWVNRFVSDTGFP